jgi:hypothetical protein
MERRALRNRSHAQSHGSVKRFWLECNEWPCVQLPFKQSRSVVSIVVVPTTTTAAARPGLHSNRIDTVVVVFGRALPPLSMSSPYAPR